MFQNDTNHVAKDVVETSGNNIKNKWNGFLISDLSKTKQEWNEANRPFSLPDNFYTGDLIKIYIYHPTESLAYIDDPKIKSIT